MPKLQTLKSTLQVLDTRRVQTMQTMQTMQAGSWRTSDQTAAQPTFLKAHPLCIRCQAEGRVEAATVVEHRIPP
ncbi:HNH endonuclease [Delftia acidovorans]|uniref:HNH endonuclease n=1 Tax=Delftia acidovorans TaxID=80866 RepID=UPI00242B8F1E|nr:HNH endonuclease [Delftia acidovorans]